MRLFEIDSADAIWDNVSANCGEILEVYSNVNKQNPKVFNFLLRGVNTSRDFFEGKSPSNRKPVDSSANIQVEFDRMLSQLGMTALRSNSIFVTSDKFHAESFGNLYMIFPFDGYKFTYTTEMDITFDSWSKFIPKMTYEKIHQAFKQHYRDFDVSYLEGDTSLMDLVDYIKDECPDDEFIQSLTYDNIVTAENIRKRYEPSNTDLGKAIATHREVYIHGSYYALSYVYYDMVVRKMTKGY